MVRILITGFRHGGDKFLPGILLNTHAHFFTKRDMFVPRLLQLRAPVAAMQNIIQSGDGLNHQKMANRRGGWRGDFSLINKPQLGEKLHRVFTGATGHALNAFLTRHRLQGHRHQRS